MIAKENSDNYFSLGEMIIKFKDSLDEMMKSMQRNVDGKPVLPDLDTSKEFMEIMGLVADCLIIYIFSRANLEFDKLSQNDKANVRSIANKVIMPVVSMDFTDVENLVKAGLSRDDAQKSMYAWKAIEGFLKQYPLNFDENVIQAAIQYRISKINN